MVYSSKIMCFKNQFYFVLSVTDTMSNCRYKSVFAKPITHNQKKPTLLFH